VGSTPTSKGVLDRRPGFEAWRHITASAPDNVPPSWRLPSNTLPQLTHVR
jgi:hypothetical protein